MKKTILITGTSSGIGEATAHYFAKKDWLVFAAMRNISNFKNELEPNMIPIKLDVTDSKSIKNAFHEVFKMADKIDVIVNNAGFGGYGAFELSTSEQRQSMFDVNVFGLMNVTHEILAHFRTNRSGLIINVSSIGGLMAYPLYSIYHSTKWAVEGFSESLNYELKHFGIRVKLIEPGVTKSNFVYGSQLLFKSPTLKVYDSYMAKLYSKVDKTVKNAIPAERVAKKIYEAATDGKEVLRYPVGNTRSVFLLALRQILPANLFIKFIRTQIER
ncbi:MAG TPA: SDR family NAD(P)-dependent oxidoreductase [Flavobacterium sp.]|nr:SDR family NAD(P)-dependent oxidoreductase [Flavobacterium sp.]